MNTISYLNSRISKPIPIVILILISIGYLFIYIFLGQKISIALVALTIIIPITFLILLFPDFGFLLTFFYSGFFFFLAKHVISKVTDIQQGIFIDILFLIVLISYILNRKYKSINISFKNPIVIILIIYLSYLILLVGNPYGSISGWMIGFRIILRQFIFIVLAVFFFRNTKNYSYFVRAWFILALLSMLYGLYQYFIGIPRFELMFAMSNELFYKLNFINGKWRIWSFLNNSTDFGLFMSSSGVFFIIYSLTKKNISKGLLILCAILMLVVGSFSGTRTATAIAVIGVIFFSLFEINNIKVISAIAIGFVIFLFTIFGPIDTPITRRVRTTFFPTEDPSYLMRENKIKIARNYIYSHPFGGGLNYNEVTKSFFASPDSYYIGAFLEKGIIGVTLFFFLLISVITTGIKAIVITKNKYQIIALLSSFFMLTIAGYAQVSMDQFPHFFVFWGTIGFVITIKF